MKIAKVLSSGIMLTLLSGGSIFAAESLTPVTTSNTAATAYSSIDVIDGKNGTPATGSAAAIRGASASQLINVYLTDNASIKATAYGKNSNSEGAAVASGFSYCNAYIASNGTVNFEGIAIGNTDVNSTAQTADAYTHVILGGVTIDGNVNITAKAIGGALTRTGDATAFTAADGMLSQTKASTVNGNLGLNIEATGSTVTGSVDVDGRTQSSGFDILLKNTQNGNITGTISAIGGTVTGTGVGVTQANTSAYGYRTRSKIKTNTGVINGNVNLTVSATGGKAVTNTGTIKAPTEAYGLYGNTTVNGNVTFNVSATGGTTNVAGTANTIACGVYALSTTTTITGDAIITTDATATQSGESFKAYSLYAAGTNRKIDLSSTGTLKQLQGDVYADNSSTVDLVLDTASSYVQGNLVQGATAGVTNISFSNGATWRPVYDNRYGTYFDVNNSATYTKDYTVDTVTTTAGTNLTVADGGVVDLTWDGSRTNYRTLELDNLAGSGGVFKVKTDLNSETDGDKIIINNSVAGTDEQLQVYDKSLVVGKKVRGPKKLLVVTDNSGLTTWTGKSLDTGGLWYITPTVERDGNNWYLVLGEGPAVTPNPTALTFIGFTDAAYGTWRSALTDDTLRKRLGDLRYMSDKEDGGIWARFKDGKLSADRYDSSYQMYQVGIDKKKNNTAYGIAVDYITGGDNYDKGSGENSMTNVSAYATTYHKSGAYSDLILKVGKYNGDIRVPSNGDRANYGAWAYSASYELGKTYRKANGWYIEPEAQLVYGHMQGADYTSNEGVTGNREAINSFLGRLGFVTGRKIHNDGDYYFKANIWREFAGNGDMHLSAVNNYDDREYMDIDGGHKDTWLEIGVGTNLKIANKTYFYGDVLKTFGGDINKKWQFNAGVRWAF